nr:MAG TPA: hypothetical protein [Caudoviricetes sp.]
MCSKLTIAHLFQFVNTTRVIFFLIFHTQCVIMKKRAECKPLRRCIYV